MNRRCSKCGGSGELICESCGGQGSFRGPTEQGSDCSMCGGLGTKDCPTCNGIGENTFRFKKSNGPVDLHYQTEI